MLVSFASFATFAACIVFRIFRNTFCLSQPFYCV